MTDDPSFSIPTRPQRRFSRTGVEYDGGSVFTLTPGEDRSTGDVASTVEDVLADGPYRHGAFLDLPMPLWLVRDDETADVFRIAVREGTVRLHVLPATESAGLRRFYERLHGRTDCEWTVDCDADPGP